MVTSAQALTPVQERTRTAILHAALPYLVRNAGASLGEVADEANVARSTLYRYFPDRDQLIAALDGYAEQEWATAVARSNPEAGTGLDAFLRLAVEMMAAWDAVIWIYTRQQARGDSASDCDTDASDPDISRIVHRGIADRSMTDIFTPEWIQGMFWAILYAVNEHAMTGGSRHEIQTQAVTTFRRMLAPA